MRILRQRDKERERETWEEPLTQSSKGLSIMPYTMLQRPPSVSMGCAPVINEELWDKLSC
jgi:hypothetical protein